jgi:predicted acyltransferase
MATVAERKAQIQAMWADISWDDVAAYIGPNANGFKTVWEKQRATALGGRGGIAWSMCWPALFLSVAWFFYRKQWLMAAILIILPAIMLAVLPIPPGAFGGIGIAIAMMAKSLYLQDALPRIAKLKAAGSGDHDALAAAGGVSLPAGIIAGVAIALATVAAIASVFS